MVLAPLPVLADLEARVRQAEEMVRLMGGTSRARADLAEARAAAAGVRRELERRAAAFAAACHAQDAAERDGARSRQEALSAGDRHARLYRPGDRLPHGTPASVRRHERAGTMLCDLCLPVRALMGREGYTAARLRSGPGATAPPPPAPALPIPPGPPEPEGRPVTLPPKDPSA